MAPDLASRYTVNNFIRVRNTHAIVDQFCAQQTEGSDGVLPNSKRTCHTGESLWSELNAVRRSIFSSYEYP
jgi:hypothetical protein